MNKKHVLIIGGGAGGAILANLLPNEEFEITVIDKSLYHVFQPGQLFVAFSGSKREFRKQIRCLLKPHVNFINKEVQEVDLEERFVLTNDGTKIDYDYVIISAGTYLDYNAIVGHKELLETYGDFYYNLESARKLWSTLKKLKKGTLFIGVADPIYKCPPAPHKAAFLAHELFRKKGVRENIRIVLAVPFPHIYSSKSVSDIIEPRLREINVELITYFTVDEIDLENKRILSLEGDQVKYDVATVIPINTGPKIKITPNNVLDDMGFIKVNKFKLNIKDFDDAFAIGDASNVPTSKSGVTAHLHAEVVADRLQGIDSRANGRTHCPIITDGEGTFVISDYDTPPIPIKMSKFKRLQEDVFIATYWVAIKYPELMRPIFESYFNATKPKVLAEMGW